MRVEVGVLGPVVVRVDGEPVEPGRLRERTLLARLAAADGEVVSVDRLLHDLWPDGPGPRAQASLHSSVSHLRRVLEPARAARAPARVLVSAAPGYALRVTDDPDGGSDGVVLDARRFARALTAAASPADLTAALGLWRGPAYAEVADAPWALAEAERLEDLRLAARERLAAAVIERGRPDAVVADLDALVREHPLREGGVRLLALALYRAGRAADALAVLRRARQSLDDHGLDPGPALRDLEVAILRHDAALTPGAGASDVTSLASNASKSTSITGEADADPEPLVGRDAELARIAAVAERVASGGPAELVVVTGEAGAGKSTLLDALARAHRQQGWTVARGRCPEDDGAPPGWPWSEIVDGVGEGTVEGGSAFVRGRAIAEVLARAGNRAPVLVALDDLHRADDETLRLLRTVVGAEVRRLLVVATRRAEATDVLASTLAALTGAIGERVALSGLGVDAVAALAGREGVSLDRAQAAQARTRTGGNPLFVREVARLARSEGPDAARHAVPDGVRDVLRRRLAGLPARTRTILAHGSVFGREVAVDVLLAFEGALREDDADDEEEVLDALETAELAGVLTGVDDGGGDDAVVTFTHDLWREVLYETLPRLRRSRRHATALEVLAATGGHVATLAHHALAAGDRVPLARTLELVAAAGEDAVAGGDHRRAVALWTAGRDAARARGASPADVLAAQCGLIAALARAGAGGALWDERDDAVALARRIGGPEPLARVLTAVDAPIPFPDKLRPGRQLGTFAEVLADPTFAPAAPERLRLLTGSAIEAELLDPARSDAHSAEALAAARELGDPRLYCAALDARFLASAAPQLWSRTAALGAEMLALAGAHGYADYSAEAHHVLCTAAIVDGDLDGALAHADAAVGCATAGQLDETLNFIGMFRGFAALAQGRTDDAEQMFAGEIERLTGIGAANAWIMGVSARFGVGHARGDTSGSVDDLAVLASFELPQHGSGIADMYATALLDAGRPDEARRAWRPDDAPTREWSWLPCAALRARLAVRLGDRALAARMHDELAPWSGRRAFSAAGLMSLGTVDETLALLEQARAGAS